MAPPTVLLDELVERMPPAADHWRGGAEQAGKTVTWLAMIIGIETAAAEMPDFACVTVLGMPRVAICRHWGENGGLFRRLKEFFMDVNTEENINGGCHDEACLATLRRDAYGNIFMQSMMTMVRGICEDR